MMISLPHGVSKARLSLLLVAASHLCAQVRPGPSTPRSAEFQARLDALALHALPGRFGVTVIDLNTEASWGIDEDQSFPMMSVFKAPVAAAVLARVDSGVISMKQKVTITRAQLDSGSAVPSIGDGFRGERMTCTVQLLLTAAVSQSDNTAVDALIRLLGGPDAVTRFLRQKGISGMHIDEDEASVSKVFANLQGGQKPALDETPEQKVLRLHQGYERFLVDPRNRTTPKAAASFLRALWANQFLSYSSTQYLLQLMYAQTIPNRLRAGLPATLRLADKCGTSNTVDGLTAAYNDIGIVTWPNGHTVIIAAFLSASDAPKESRDAIFHGLASDTVQALGHSER